jgi:hypothetical protein
MTDGAIIYGRPRYLAPLLIVAVAGAVAGAVIAYLTYGRIDTASNATVLGNRAVTERLTRDEARRELENDAHRERNEQAHACLIWLDIRILHDLGDHGFDVNLANDRPCDADTLPGSVPPLPTTTTTARRRTTTTRRSTPATQHTTTTRRTPASTTTTMRPPRCPHNTLPVSGVCRPVSGP